MATRYYTEEAYEQIKQTIEQIRETDVNPVVDFFDDLLKRIGQFLQIYSVEDYENDMQNWYNLVLDSHNTTLNKVLDIFKDVDTVDREYQEDIMSGAVNSIVCFQNTLNCLRDVISGKISLADGKTAAAGFLTNGREYLLNAYDVILTKAEQRTLWDASKALFSDAIKLGSGYIKCMLGSGNVADYKKLGDTLLATGCDLLAMASIVLAPLGAVGDALDGKMDMSYEEYLDARLMLLKPAQGLKDVNSVSDLLENLAEDMNEQLGRCSENSVMYPIIKTTADITQKTSDVYKVIDAAIDLYGIGKDLKDIHGTIDGWVHGKEHTVGEFVDKFKYKPIDDWEIIDSGYTNNKAILRVRDTPSGILKTIASNWLGVPFSGWKDPSKFDGNVYKTIGTIWSYGEKFLPDPATGQSNTSELPDVFLGKFKDTKLLKDIFDFARDNLITEVK